VTYITSFTLVRWYYYTRI